MNSLTKRYFSRFRQWQKLDRPATFTDPNKAKYLSYIKTIDQEKEWLPHVHDYEVYLADTERDGFEIDPKFIVRKGNPLKGHFRPDYATNVYVRRHSKVHRDNWHKDGRSRFVYGTKGGLMLPKGDFRQYNCMKHAILSGVNQIDTSLAYRCHRSEHVVGAVLQTLIKKYGMNRAEIYITSK